jgi:SNF2 family DNA or RNA helicase
MQAWLYEAGIFFSDLEGLQIVSWSTPHTYPVSDGMIFDEAHYAKNYYSDRTKKMLTACLARDNKGEIITQYVWFLTGTPNKNGKPSEYFPFIKACLHPWGDSITRYKEHFCIISRQAFGRRVLERETIRQLHEPELQELLAQIMITIKASDVIDLPPLVRKNIEVAGPVIRDKKVYKTTQGATLAMMAERKDNSFLKSRYVAENITQFIDNGEQLVIYATYLESSAHLESELRSKGYAVGRLVGNLSKVKRYDIVQAFEKKEIDIIIISDAGKEGINLQTASKLLFIDLPWTPGDLGQIEGRIYRRGQQASVVTFYRLLMGDIDKAIAKILVSKDKKINSMGARAVQNKIIRSLKNSYSESQPETVAQPASLQASQQALFVPYKDL